MAILEVPVPEHSRLAPGNIADPVDPALSSLIADFGAKLDSDSGRHWTPIPVETGHRFRAKVDSDCGGRPTTVGMFTGLVWGV